MCRGFENQQTESILMQDFLFDVRRSSIILRTSPKKVH
jgi:hypothetical protein